jgi:endothelin-converting enzyme
MAEPRPSTDQETAPLLRDPEAEENGHEGRTNTFKDRANALLSEPLTGLSKILLVVALILLLLSSVFIGLFAGTQHKLNVERGKHDGSTVTVTATQAPTSVPTTKTQVTTTTVAGPGPTNSPDQPACLSPQCILLSASILSSLDTTQDPCENFYDFANGGWLKEHPVPADKASYGQFEGLAKKNQQIIQSILEANVTVAADGSIVPSYDNQLLHKLQNMYTSCTDETTLNELGQAPLEHIIKTLRALYQGKSTDISVAIPEDERDGPRALTAAIAYLHSLGVGSLFDFSVEGDGLRPNDMSLWFSQPNLGLPSKEYYEEQAVLDLYEDVIFKILLGLDEKEKDAASAQYEGQAAFSLKEDKSRSNVWPPWPWPPWEGDEPSHPGDGSDNGRDTATKRAKKLAKQVVQFETKIANASLDLDVLQQDPIGTYNPVPISNLTSTLNRYIDIPSYLATFAPRTYPTQVIITYLPYPESLASILADASESVVEAYLVSQTALQLADYLSMETEVWKAARTLKEELMGLKKGVVGERTEFCAANVENALGFAMGRYFVNETFGLDEKATSKASKVITDIVSSFKNSLKHIEWMDKKSAKAAAEKADAIRVKVGYPLFPDTRDPAALLSYYRKAEVHQDTFFDNMISVAKNDAIWKWAKLGAQRNPNAWEMYASTVNAYFNPPANEIVFPAGILQPPFFSADWPSYLAYGAFGQVAAHELTHAFDSAGRLYNQEGKLEEWWTNATSEGFDRKQECIVKQYSEYTIDDGKGGKVHVNGNLTSGENIGDTGLIQAYRAWKTQFGNSFMEGNEYLLPGLNFTQDQLFFISFGRIWARSMKPAAAVARIRTDPHSPSRYRVDGTLYNIPEFAKAFECSKKAKLNPPMEERCLFWS